MNHSKIRFFIFDQHIVVRKTVNAESGSIVKLARGPQRDGPAQGYHVGHRIVCKSQELSARATDRMLLPLTIDRLPPSVHSIRREATPSLHGPLSRKARILGGRYVALMTPPLRGTPILFQLLFDAL
jgi:hypothetical protein